MLSPLTSISINVSALSPYDPGYSHGYDNYVGYAVYDISNADNPEYDCSEDSQGCHGLIYCDLNDEVACYDRYD
jgi:hypothetical protein